MQPSPTLANSAPECSITRAVGSANTYRRPAPAVSLAHALRHDQRGLSSVEYAVLFVVIVIGGLATWKSLASKMSTQVSAGTTTFNAALNAAQVGNNAGGKDKSADPAPGNSFMKGGGMPFGASQQGSGMPLGASASPQTGSSRGPAVVTGQASPSTPGNAGGFSNNSLQPSTAQQQFSRTTNGDSAKLPPGTPKPTEPGAPIANPNLANKQRNTKDDQRPAHESQASDTLP